MRSSFALFGLCLAAACASASAPVPATPAEVIAIDPCAAPTADGHFLFWDGSLPLMPNIWIVFKPLFMAASGQVQEVAPACVGNVAVSDPMIAYLSHEDRMLHIKPDAPVGREVVLTATFGSTPVSARALITMPLGKSLIGTWAQSGLACPELARVRELVFAPDGTFSVTWKPYESYQDYWGTYAFNSDTDELVLTIEAGNSIPDNVVLSGKVKLTSDTLQLGNISLGSPPASGRAACPGHFDKFNAQRP